MAIKLVRRIKQTRFFYYHHYLLLTFPSVISLSRGVFHKNLEPYYCDFFKFLIRFSPLYLTLRACPTKSLLTLTNKLNITAMHTQQVGMKMHNMCKSAETIVRCRCCCLRAASVGCWLFSTTAVQQTKYCRPRRTHYVSTFSRPIIMIHYSYVICVALLSEEW